MSSSAQADRVFVGRKAELEALRGALDRALAGRGGMFLIAGEPGIGKSELADRLGREAIARGAEVLWGRSWEGEGAPPYWPWAQVLRTYAAERPGTDVRTIFGGAAAYVGQIVPELRDRLSDPTTPSTLDSEQARFRLFDAITTFLKGAAGTRPLVLTLDDLHWADKPSLLLLQFLAREIADAPVLVVAGYRDVEVSRGHPLAELLPSLRRERTVERILVRGLPEDDVAAMLAALRGERLPDSLALAISRETEGNPFFIQEIVRHLIEEGVLSHGGAGWTSRSRLDEIGLPESIRDVIGRRLGRLSEDCTKLLTVAAVLGREFGLEALARVAALDRERLFETLEEAINARVVEEAPDRIGRYRFSHALVRDSLYEELNTLERFRHHLRVAEVLEALYSHDVDSHLAELAHHFRQALPGGDVEKAIDYSIRAGDHANAQLAYEEAVIHYERALQALELQAEPDLRLRCRLLLKRGEAGWSAGLDLPRGLTEAADLAERLGDAESLAQAALACTGYDTGIFFMGDESLQLMLLLRALAALGEHDSALRARVLARISTIRVFVDMGGRIASPGAGTPKLEHLPDSPTLARIAIDMARRVGDKAALANVLATTTWSTCGPDDVEEVLALADELIRRAGEIGDIRLEAEGRRWKAYHHLETGDIEAAEREEAIEDRLAERSRQADQRRMTFLRRGQRAVVEGRFEEAEQLLAEAGVAPIDNTTFHPGMVNVLREQQGRAAELLPDVALITASYPRAFIWRVSEAAYRATLGRTHEVRTALESLAANDFADVQRDLVWLFTIARLADVVAHVGDAKRAAILYDLLLPYRDRFVLSPMSTNRGSVSRPLGVLATLLGRHDEAEEHFERALERNARIRARIWIAHTLHDFARMLVARDRPGDRERAAALSAEALNAAREIGMKPLEARLVELRAAAGFEEAVQPASAAASTASFRRSGDFWTIAYEGKALRLKDAKGLRYIAELLRNEGREVHATDLAAGGEDETREQRADRGDAGEVLDAQARSEYRQRIEDLEAELDEATRWSDAGRALRIREEIEILNDELSSAFGLGGRPRTTGSAAERARKAVASRVQDTIARIRKEHAALAHHFENSIRMGAFCSYAPERPVEWQL